MRLQSMILTGLLTMTMATPVLAAREIDLQCMQQTMERRESNYITAWQTYTNSIQNAKQNRKNSLVSAWIIQDQDSRNDTIRAAEKAFRTAEKDARKALRNTEQQISRTYKSEQKGCRR